MSETESARTPERTPAQKRWIHEDSKQADVLGLMDDSDEDVTTTSQHTVQATIWGQLYGLIVCIFYAVASTVITLVNKATFSQFGFKQTDVLFLAQIFMSIICLYSFRWCGWIEFDSFKFDTIRKVFLLSVSFVGMVLCGLMALSLNNIPMYSALLRQTTLLVLVQEFVVLGNTQPARQIVAVLIMCVGALIAAWNDLHGSLGGYTMGIVACFFTSSYTIQMKRVTQTTSLRLFDIMLYNNVLAFPCVLVFVLIRGSLKQAILFPHWSDELFQLSFFFSASLAFVLNYSIFLCTHVNSPLTTSIVGNLKNLVTDVVGLFAFPDVSRTPLYLTGIGIATFGGLLYSSFSVMQLREAAAKAGMIPVATHEERDIEMQPTKNSQK